MGLDAKSLAITESVIWPIVMFFTAAEDARLAGGIAPDDESESKLMTCGDWDFPLFVSAELADGGLLGGRVLTVPGSDPSVWGDG